MTKILIPSDISWASFLVRLGGEKKQRQHLLPKVKLLLITSRGGEAKKEDWTRLEDLQLQDLWCGSHLCLHFPVNEIVANNHSASKQLDSGKDGVRTNSPLQNVKYVLHIMSRQKEENYSLATGAFPYSLEEIKWMGNRKFCREI